MKRLFRLLRLLTVALYLLFFIAAITLWLRSHWRMDVLYIVGNDQVKGIGNARDGISMWSICCPVVEPETRFGSGEADTLGFFGPGHLGFVYVRPAKRTYKQGELIGGLTIPHYAPLVLTSILLLASNWHWIRKRRRRRLGLCPTCGYDIRATPARCPECGQSTTPLRTG